MADQPRQNVATDKSPKAQKKIVTIWIALFTIALIRVSNGAKQGMNTGVKGTDPKENLVKNIDCNPFIASNSSQYTWTGNHFIPPKGVPTFSPADFQSYFKRRNVLFIGDSTARRAYGTLFGMMTSTDFSNIHQIELDSASVIDFNKPRQRKEKCMNMERSLSSLNSPYYVCRNVTGLAKSNNGKFDFIPMACLSEIIHFFTQNMTLQAAVREDYDLIVVAAGVWEGVRAIDCAMKVPVNGRNASQNTQTLVNAEKFELFLDALFEASSPSLQIVIRTPGFAEGHMGDAVIWELSKHIKRRTMTSQCVLAGLDANEENNEDLKHFATANITVVDWGAVIAKRSYGPDRIIGDLKPHYGLEARLLFAQQLLHELLRSETNRIFS